jgi:transposase
VKFLADIDAAVPAEDGVTIHLVLDNYATHKTPAIKTWLLAHPRFHLHFTPTGSSWLNLVKRWFAELTNKQIRRGVHRSVQALEKDIRAWIAAWNTDPKPYVWTKTANEILERLASHPNRIPDSEDWPRSTGGAATTRPRASALATFRLHGSREYAGPTNMAPKSGERPEASPTPLRDTGNHSQTLGTAERLIDCSATA